MILASIFQTVEFYVIVSVIAAAIVAASCLPAGVGEARTFLYGGELRDSGCEVTEPVIVALVATDGTLGIHRFGLDGVSFSGAYSLAVRIIGLNVTIEERLTPGRRGDEPADSASAILDCLGPERYHFKYVSEATGRSTAFSLNMRPGNRIERRLS